MIERQTASSSPQLAIMARIRAGLLVAITFSTACWIGCGKKKDATDAAPPPSPAAEAAMQTPNPAPETQAAATAPAEQNNEPLDLNRELRKWILRNRRPPKNFEDFSSTARVQIPPPPDGKKYTIDKSMHVVLVKR